MGDVLAMAMAAAGWASDAAHVAVFVWFSPPCETYSGMALGTNSCEKMGGPQRQDKESAYLPVSGARGAEARRADRLVCKVLGWLHRHTSTC